ncbi:MAG: VanZ family protein [Pseudohongiellaceae bacterium]
MSEEEEKVGQSRIISMPLLRTVYQLTGWALLLFVVVLSLWPNLSVPDVGVSWSDKLGHFGAWLVLMLWFAQLQPRPGHLWLALRLVALGIFIEILQWLSGYRYFELGDIAANTAGVAAGWLISGTKLGRLL